MEGRRTDGDAKVRGFVGFDMFWRRGPGNATY